MTLLPLQILFLSGSGQKPAYLAFNNLFFIPVSFFIGEFVDILGGMLDSKYKESNGMLSVCQTLAALAGIKQVEFLRLEGGLNVRQLD